MKTKTKVKVFSIFLIVITILLEATTFVLAATNSSIDPNEYNPMNSNYTFSDRIVDLVGIIATVLQVIGIVILVIVLMIYGIRYMIGSVEERAEYKKVIIPILAGAVFIMITGTLVRFIYNLTSQASA